MTLPSAGPPAQLAKGHGQMKTPSSPLPTASDPVRSVPMKLPRTALPDDASQMPWPLFPETTLRSAGEEPPITFPVPLKTLMPWDKFWTAIVPVASTPTYEPVTELFEPLISIPEPSTREGVDDEVVEVVAVGGEHDAGAIAQTPVDDDWGPERVRIALRRPVDRRAPSSQRRSGESGRIVQTPATQPGSVNGMLKMHRARRSARVASMIA